MINPKVSLLDFSVLLGFFGLISFEALFVKIFGIYDLRIAGAVSFLVVLIFLATFSRRRSIELGIHEQIFYLLVTIWTFYVIIHPVFVGVLWLPLQLVVMSFSIGVWLFGICLVACGVRALDVSPMHQWVMGSVILVFLVLFGLSVGNYYYSPNQNWLLIGVMWALTFYFSSQYRNRHRSQMTLFVCAMILTGAAAWLLGSFGGLLASVASVGAVSMSKWSKGVSAFIVIIAVGWLAPVVVVVAAPEALYALFDSIEAIFGYDVSSNRFEKWKVLLKVVLDGDLWFGIGLSAIPKTIPDFRAENLTTAHNIFVVSVVRAGIIGYMLLVGLWLSLFWCGMHKVSPNRRAFFMAVIAQLFVFSMIYDIGGFTHWEGTVAYMVLTTYFSREVETKPAMGKPIFVGVRRGAE